MTELESPSEVKKVIHTYEVKRYNPKTCLQQYSYALIRPPRFLYNEDILLPRRKYKDKFNLETFHIPFPLSLYTQPNMKYVILYLHGNSSSRYQGYTHLQHLPAQVGLATFDFNGCGNRKEKSYISLGKSEANQVDLVVKFLKTRGYMIVLWGRSMGSVSALLSTQCDVIVADSPFSSLKLVCKELALTQVPCACVCCFHCLFPCFFWMISNDVQKKSNVHPQQLQVAQNLSKANPNKSIIFLAGKGDSMINFSHAQKLFDTFPGFNKKILLFEGTHNSERPRQIIFETFLFIDKSLELNSHKNLTTGMTLSLTKKSQDSELGSMSLLKQNKDDLIIQTKNNKFQIELKADEGCFSQKDDMNQQQKIIDNGSNYPF